MEMNDNEKRTSRSGKTSRIWLWIGVIVLIAIILYWIFCIGTAGDLAGSFNG